MITSSVSLIAQTQGSQLHRSEERWVGGTITEAVSGLSQQALLIDVAAKILADNIASLMCAAAGVHAGLASRSRKCNRSYAATFMQRVLPRLVLFIGDVCAAIAHAIDMLGANSPSDSSPADPGLAHNVTSSRIRPTHTRAEA